MTKHRSTDALAALLAHNAWANRRLLGHCGTIDEDALHERFDIGPGSVHDALAHIIGAMYRWEMRMRGERLPTARFEGPAEGPKRFDLEELRAHHELAHDQLVCLHHTLAHDDALGRTFRPEDAEHVEISHLAAFVHVATHGAHHRAQIMHMLRRLGAPGPDVDAAEWAEVTREAVE